MNDNVVATRDKYLLTIREASAISGIGLNTLRNLVKDDSLGLTVVNGSHRLVKREALREFCNKTKAL